MKKTHLMMIAASLLLASCSQLPAPTSSEATKVTQISGVIKAEQDSEGKIQAYSQNAIKLYGDFGGTVSFKTYDGTRYPLTYSLLNGSSQFEMKLEPASGTVALESVMEDIGCSGTLTSTAGGLRGTATDSLQLMTFKTSYTEPVPATDTEPAKPGFTTTDISSLVTVSDSEMNTAPASFGFARSVYVYSSGKTTLSGTVDCGQRALLSNAKVTVNAPLESGWNQLRLQFSYKPAIGGHTATGTLIPSAQRTGQWRSSAAFNYDLGVALGQITPPQEKPEE